MVLRGHLKNKLDRIGRVPNPGNQQIPRSQIAMAESPGDRSRPGGGAPSLPSFPPRPLPTGQGPMKQIAPGVLNPRMGIFPGEGAGIPLSGLPKQTQGEARTNPRIGGGVGRLLTKRY